MVIKSIGYFRNEFSYFETPLQGYYSVSAKISESWLSYRVQYPASLPSLHLRMYSWAKDSHAAMSNLPHLHLRAKPGACVWSWKSLTVDIGGATRSRR